MAAEVSGKAFLGVIRYVKDKGGPEALPRIVEACDDATRAVFAKPIGVMSWYPYQTFATFLRVVDRQLGAGNTLLCRDIGTSAGARDLGTVFKIYRALASAEKLIRACTKVWPSYYRNAGRMEAVTWEPTNTTLRIYDFPEMDPRHCRLMEGWMISTMAQIGCKVHGDGMEVKCMSRGAEYHEFHCTWSPNKR